MNGGAGPPPTQRRHRRAGIQTRVDLEYRGLTRFVSGMSEDISPAGMFVRLDELPPEGTRLRFGFRLEPETPVVRGLGEVVWVRTEDEGPEKPKGAAIRYVVLGDDDRARIAAASRRDEAAAVPAGPPGDDLDDTASVPPPQASGVDPGELPVTPGEGVVERASEAAPTRSGEVLPFPWPLVAGMVAVVVLVVSIGALVLGPAGGGRAPAAASDGPLPAPTRRAIREATRVEEIRWSGSLGSTRVEVLLDGMIDAGQIGTEAQLHPPRFVLRLRGVAPGGVGDLHEVGASDIRRVRLVERSHEDSLEVVLDLAVATVRVGVRSEGNRVVLETR